MRRGSLGLALVCGVGFLTRVGYLIAQRAADPSFARPALDGAVYWSWAGRLAAGEGSPAGAYYLAPLYPLLLGAWRAAAGDWFFGLYLLQHGMIVLAAWLLAGVASNAGGKTASFATALLVLGYHPGVFFASRPLSEPLAILLTACALALAAAAPREPSTRSTLAGGVFAGLAALSRPNLLLLVPAWSGLSWWSGRRRAALLLLGAASLVIFPVALRNFSASGHLVPISSNAGMTLYHGNAPGARGGLTPIAGLSGSPLAQRDEATAIAGLRSGRALDAVEADRWWGRQAIAARLASPGDSLALLIRRAGLTLANAELGLDAAPALDTNPWRRALPFPFAVIAGLAAAGLAARGFAGSGGRECWSAIAACALTPLVFYVSSRYRLPLTALLTVPAGCGVAAILDGWRGRPAGSVRLPLATALIVIGVSLSIPTGGLERSQTAGALANRVAQRLDAGDSVGALRDADASLALEPSAHAQFNRGKALLELGRQAEAEAAWRAAIALDPLHAEAAGELAGVWIRTDRASAAIPLLRRVLTARPTHVVCWTNLVVAQAAAGQLDGARRTAGEARSRGVALDPGLLDAIAGDRP